MLIEHEIGHDPFSGALYVFGNRACTKVTCLFWENNGSVLYYKSLAEERFHWPGNQDELITLNGEQLNWLLSGYNLSAMKPHRSLHYESTG